MSDMAEQTYQEVAQHVCPAVRETLALVKTLAERLDRLEATLRVQAGQLERWELWMVAQDRAYPLTQAHIRDLEARRDELQQRIKGGRDAGRS